MSVKPPKAEVSLSRVDVRKVPNPDIGFSATSTAKLRSVMPAEESSTASIADILGD